jgi:excisionase family DNA binding protein
MTDSSTREAAKKLGLNASTLVRYIQAKKIPAPKTVKIGRLSIHSWTEKEIEEVRKILPKIANGRKTRWQKERAKKKSQGKGPKKTSKKK